MELVELSKEQIKQIVAANPLLKDGDIDLHPTLRRIHWIWLREAITALLERGVNLHRVITVYSATNEDKLSEQSSVRWLGQGITVENERTRFSLTWHLDPEKFGREAHYYVLDDVQVGDSAWN